MNGNPKRVTEKQEIKNILKKANAYYSGIDELGLTPKVYERIKAAGISTIEQLHESSDEELLGVEGLGVKSLQKIRLRISEYAKNCPQKPSPYFEKRMEARRQTFAEGNNPSLRKRPGTLTYEGMFPEYASRTIIKEDWILGPDGWLYKVPIIYEEPVTQILFLPSECDKKIEYLKNLRDNFTDEWVLEYNEKAFKNRADEIRMKLEERKGSSEE